MLLKLDHYTHASFDTVATILCYEHLHYALLCWQSGSDFCWLLPLLWPLVCVHVRPVVYLLVCTCLCWVLSSSAQDAMDNDGQTPLRVCEMWKKEDWRACIELLKKPDVSKAAHAYHHFTKP